MPACTRASVTAEKAGIPSVTVALSGFAEQGRLVAKGKGFHSMPIAEYPDRNRNRICHQNSRQGFPTSKRIQLPFKWEKLIALKEKHRV